MGRIIFHSLQQDAEVRGFERAYFSNLLANIALNILNFDFYEEALKKSIAEADPDNYLMALPHRFKTDFPIWFRTSYGKKMMIRGKLEDVFLLQLNTALAIGNDSIKLAARIHGQCEIHCFVEGTNRRWLAEIIRKGRQIGLYRHKVGWEQVVTLLELDDQEPVVLSYSVCESFPNASIAGYGTESDEDAWYTLSLEEKWNLALSGLRKEPGLEIKPENQNEFFFGYGVTAFDIVKSCSGDPSLWIPEQ